VSKTIELGDEVRCKITGFQGVVTSLAKCLTGCDRLVIQPAMGKDKKHPDSLWFDVAACEIVKKQKVKAVSVQEPESPTAKKGGPPSRNFP
jgi:hypothetical protein